MKICLSCKENIQEGASVCPHCRKSQPNLAVTVVVTALFFTIFFAGYRLLVSHYLDEPIQKRADREQELDQTRAKATPEARSQFADKTESFFLDQYIEAKFSASGKKRTTLRITVPYFNIVDEHAIGKKLDWGTIKALGFKEVVYTDGRRSGGWDVP